MASKIEPMPSRDREGTQTLICGLGGRCSVRLSYPVCVSQSFLGARMLVTSNQKSHENPKMKVTSWRNAESDRIAFAVGAT